MGLLSKQKRDKERESNETKCCWQISEGEGQRKRKHTILKVTILEKKSFLIETLLNSRNILHIIYK